MRSKGLVRLTVLVVVFLFTLTSIWLTGQKVQAESIPPPILPILPLFRSATCMPTITSSRTSTETLSLNPCLPVTLQAEHIIISTLSVNDTMKTPAITPLLPFFIHREDNEDHMIEKSNDKQPMVLAALGYIPFF